MLERNVARGVLMTATASSSASRVDWVDALRGSALVGILLWHAIEHWDFLRYPERTPEWIRPLDRLTTKVGHLLFAGKAYAIFAMLFGVSFYLILRGWSRRGAPFRSLFLYRIALLGIFGYLHGILYCGDVLLVMAALGVPLLLVHWASSRVLVVLSTLLLLQIPGLWQTFRVVTDAAYQPPEPHYWSIYRELSTAFADGSLWEVSVLNLGPGQLSRIWWNLETGRASQMLGLFLWGLLLGRSGALDEVERAVGVARRVLPWGIVGTLAMTVLQKGVEASSLEGLRLLAVEGVVTSYRSLAQTVVWASGFVLLYQWAKSRALLSLLAPYGRMSLTAYVTQGLVGVPLFYGYGLGLYRHLGPFYSGLLGCGLVVAQVAGAHWWFRWFAYGPLEWLWRCLTFRSFATPLRRRPREEVVVDRNARSSEPTRGESEVVRAEPAVSSSALMGDVLAVPTTVEHADGSSRKG